MNKKPDSKLTFAIIGAGSGGRAFAVYLKNLGYNVNLVFRNPQHIREILIRYKIVAEGEIKGIYSVDMVTDDYKKAIENADVILYVVPADVHKSITNDILPFIKNDQIILLNPGRTWGAIEVYNEIIKYRPHLNVYIGETQTLLFTCRKISSSGVSIIKVKEQVDYCFYPEKNNSKVIPLFKKIFPQLNPVDDICITSLNNMGCIIHPCTSLLNAGSISRKGSFKFYSDGIESKIADVIEEVDKERCKILEKMGIKPYTFLEWANKVYNCEEDDYYKAFHKIKSYKDVDAPQKLRNRYLTEDVPCGLVPLSSLGDYFDVSTPMINSLITLANTILKTDFTRNGRTIENVNLPNSILKRKKLSDFIDLSGFLVVNQNQ
ncbi:MAG: NAD/NADP octopine/nopaline dehydrogenase family protein [Promethearchaeota archaeon]